MLREDTKSENHRMTQVGKDLKDPEAPNPVPGRAATLPHALDHVAQGPIPPGIEHLQRRGIHNLPGQPVPGPHHSLSKELPPNIQPKSSLFHLTSLSPCLAIISPFKEFTPLLIIGSLQVLKGCNEVTLQPSFLQAEQSQLPQPVFVGEVLQPPDHVRGLPLGPFQ